MGEMVKNGRNGQNNENWENEQSCRLFFAEKMAFLEYFGVKMVKNGQNGKMVKTVKLG